MASRPKRPLLSAPSLLSAQSVSAPPPPEDCDDDSQWARERAAALANGEVTVEAAPSVVVASAPQPSAAPQKSRAEMAKEDRAHLERWWADELISIEASLNARRALLAKAGPHPNRIIAREVMGFGAKGIPKEVAARLLRMHEVELERHYGAEYDCAAAEVIARAAENLMRISRGTNDRYAVKAVTEFLNRRGGEPWRPPAQKIDMTTQQKAPNVIDSSKLTFDERQALKAIIERALSRAALPAPAEDGSEG
jgi:hypothetical protein